MSRYRPPQPKASPYITRDGYHALEQEAKTLWQRRAEVTKALSAAAAEGDRSENAEYIYRKRELAGIDRRIRYLQKRMPDLTVVDRQPDNCEQVFFGAWITLEDEEGNERSYRIVGADEIDSAKENISLDSPMAKALLKRFLDDEVKVQTPSGLLSFVITDIRY